MTGYIHRVKLIIKHDHENTISLPFISPRFTKKNSSNSLHLVQIWFQRAREKVSSTVVLLLLVQYKHNHCFVYQQPFHRCLPKLLAPSGLPKTPHTHKKKREKLHFGVYIYQIPGTRYWSRALRNLSSVYKY